LGNQGHEQAINWANDLSANACKPEAMGKSEAMEAVLICRIADCYKIPHTPLIRTFALIYERNNSSSY
jgi:hypothetical protein